MVGVDEMGVCRFREVGDTERTLYAHFHTLFGESRVGLLDAPIWLAEIAEIEDEVRVWYLRERKEKERQKELLKRAGVI